MEPCSVQRRAVVNVMVALRPSGISAIIFRRFASLVMVRYSLGRRTSYGDMTWVSVRSVNVGSLVVMWSGIGLHAQSGRVQVMLNRSQASMVLMVMSHHHG